MSEAPERIMIDASEAEYLCAQRFPEHPDDPKGVAYVSEDHSAALVAAAYQAAAKAAFQACKAVGTGYKDENERILRRAENEMRLETQKAIRALTPADAQAALESLIQKAVDAERERCARVATSCMSGLKNPASFGQVQDATCLRIAAAIREGKA